jgi:hypothetical protein
VERRAEQAKQGTDISSGVGFRIVREGLIFGMRSLLIIRADLRLSHAIIDSGNSFVILAEIPMIRSSNPLSKETWKLLRFV